MNDSSANWVKVKVWTSVWQRFKGTEPVEDVTEQIKAVKIEDKPKEVKAEVVDEVLSSWFI